MNALSEDLDNVKAGCGAGTSIAVRPDTRHGRASMLGGVETRLANLETNVVHILEILTQMNQRQGMFIVLIFIYSSVKISTCFLPESTSQPAKTLKSNTGGVSFFRIGMQNAMLYI